MHNLMESEWFYHVGGTTAVINSVPERQFSKILF